MVQERRHWNTIDFIKGLLIILVFWGHLIVGEQRTTFLRYVIYSFICQFSLVCQDSFLISKRDLKK